MSIEIIDLFGDARPAIDEADLPSKRERTDYTSRNAAQFERGVHPATLQSLLDPAMGLTCGECTNCAHIGKYIKCRRHRLGMSRSEASDIRASWSACVLWRPR